MDPELLVMSSVRKPKRIKFFGSDGVERMFLVKGGEDLRNDERIELLFEIMNSIVATSSSEKSNDPKNNHQNSVRSNLRARTYTVIPMTSQVGILEWVCNTIPIKSVIISEMLSDPLFRLKNPKFGDETGLDLTEAATIRRNSMQITDPASYHKMFKEMTRDTIIDIHDKMNNVLPDNFIRKKLLKMSQGPESFITLRTEFSKSLAVSNLFGYVLGLGDRHLENLLMDERTGGIIQIDFGVCFGMGQSILPVPELIPFRLSPQLRGVLRPLNGTGLLRHYMVQAMAVLRLEEGVNILTNYLQVTPSYYLLIYSLMSLFTYLFTHLPQMMIYY